jgi:hypothetical protein
MRAALLLLTVLALSACGISEAELKSGINKSMQEQLDSDNQFKQYGMKVTSIDLIKKTSNTYEGFGNVSFKGNQQKVPISVTVDGSNYLWKAEPPAFAFIAQYELEVAAKEMEREGKKLELEANQMIADADKEAKQIEREIERDIKALERETK